MASRVSEVNTDSNQNIRQSTGKIFKGTINDAPMKVRVASIPSKLQNVIYRLNKTPAFGNSRDRFYSQSQNLKLHEPGPANYLNPDNTSHKIFSKKGYGSLISNTKLDRLQKKYTGLPGPGSYNPKPTLLSRSKRSNSLALLSSKLQGHQLFRTELEKSKHIPGPGNYQVRINKSSSQAHPFQNHISRFDNLNEQTPGVGYYNYNTSSLQRQQNSPKIQYKKAGPQINEISYQNKLKIVRQILNSTKKNIIDTEKEVGPGVYNARTIDTKIGFKIHQTSYDRFGESIKRNKFTDKAKDTLSEDAEASMFAGEEVFSSIPESKDGFSSTKALTSMFKSNLARYDFVKPNLNDPGRYSPEKLQKKSHLVNFQKKWI